MKIIKPGTHEPELEGTCPRCGQVEGLEQSECGIFAGIFHKSCSLCGCAMRIEKPIDRPIQFFVKYLSESGWASYTTNESIEQIKSSHKNAIVLEIHTLTNNKRELVYKHEHKCECKPIDRPSAGAMRDFLIQIQYHTAAAQAELLLETFDIRRKK